jgi:hypothetical protein
VEDQYRIWALVRNVAMLEQKTGQGALLEVGVAFVGKRPPRSFADAPSSRYEIAATPSGLWVVQEESEDVLSQVIDTDKRKYSRHTIPVELRINVFDEDGKLVEGESTVTENISTQGAAVFTTLSLIPGRFVKVSSIQFGVEMLAAVRDRHVGPDGIARLHLQFIGGEWPLSG